MWIWLSFSVLDNLTSRVFALVDKVFSLIWSEERGRGIHLYFGWDVFELNRKYLASLKTCRPRQILLILSLNLKADNIVWPQSLYARILSLAPLFHLSSFQGGSFCYILSRSLIVFFCKLRFLWDYFILRLFEFSEVFYCLSFSTQHKDNSPTIYSYDLPTWAQRLCVMFECTGSSWTVPPGC